MSWLQGEYVVPQAKFVLHLTRDYINFCVSSCLSQLVLRLTLKPELTMLVL